jgi:hypothetical protein
MTGKMCVFLRFFSAHGVRPGRTWIGWRLSEHLAHVTSEKMLRSIHAEVAIGSGELVVCFISSLTE